MNRLRERERTVWVRSPVTAGISTTWHPGTTVWAIKQGIPALCVTDEYLIFGYRGTLDFAYSVLNTIKNRSFESNLASRVKLPYTDWWYQQNNATFLKDEVGQCGQNTGSTEI
jgi:nitrogenase molybdenum-iron protein alpha/beta subunit